MHRYLLVLDRELISTGEYSPPKAISYIARRQEQEPCEVTVLSLLTSRQPQVPPFMSLYVADKIGRYPKAPLPDQDIRAAERRMDSAVQQLETTGCHATGVLTGQRQVVRAVRAETHGHHYDQVILATSQRNGSWLARILLRLRLGRRLVIFPLGSTAQPAPVA